MIYFSECSFLSFGSVTDEQNVMHMSSPCTSIDVCSKIVLSFETCGKRSFLRDSEKHLLYLMSLLSVIFIFRKCKCAACLM